MWVYTLVAGKRIGNYMDLTADILEDAQEAIRKLNAVMPVGTDDIALTILEIARSAALAAEQLFKSGAIDKKARKAVALDYAHSALAALDIDLSAPLAKMLDCGIEAACLLDIPHLSK